jgi:hypothetical protein
MRYLWVSGEHILAVTQPQCYSLGMRSRQDVCADALEAVQMILLWLKHRNSDRMRPIGGGPVLDIARKILQLELQPANRSGYRSWRVRRGVEDRLRYAGIDPETGHLVNAEKWQLALDRAIGELQDRKARKQLWKAKRAAMILEARKQQAFNQPTACSDFGRRPTYDQRVMVNGTGLGRELNGESAPAAPSPSEPEVGSGRRSFGRPAVTSNEFEIVAPRVPPSGPPHKRRSSSLISLTE